MHGKVSWMPRHNDPVSFTLPGSKNMLTVVTTPFGRILANLEITLKFYWGSASSKADNQQINLMPRFTSLLLVSSFLFGGRY
ncbi:hypothetical protein L3Y34_011433 [Caenorhabditis briggsae]|uniref:Uncharacterized protein n=1 Tax=Caenorhabditis briggsae TaxID=6238 RepID=A0AAE8ZNX2_CAEBR|nr:hypothetical protein L3Y34_011433 [Caenorhabditis briggsae]